MKGRKAVRTLILIILDVLFLIGSWCLAIYLTSFMFLYNVVEPSVGTVLRYSYIWILYYLVAFWSTGIYRSMWQYVGVGTVIRLVCAVAACNFAVYCALRLFGPWPNPAIGMLSFFFMLTLSGGVRVSPFIKRAFSRWWRRVRGKISVNQTEPIPVLMVGAGESASTLMLNLNKHTRGSRPRKVLAIVDVNPYKHGLHLHGAPVEGDDSKIPALVDKYNIEEVIIAIPSISDLVMQRIIRYIPMQRCKVQVLKPFAEQISGTREILKDLEISDLLGRPETLLDTEGISRWIRGNTIMVTGGGGSIGSELCRQLLLFEPKKIIVFDISENNAYNLEQELFITYGRGLCERLIARIGSALDEERLNEVMEEFKPSVIFHAAAFKHVPLMEECPRLAVKNNVIGTRTVGLCAIKHGVERFVLISTDKAVNPTNVMGASKRMAELVIQSLNARAATEFVAVRFGNVLGSNGSVVPVFRRQIEMGGPVTVTHPDIIRYFMTIPEAARLVIQAGAIAKGGEIFILDMGAPVKIVDLAENLIRMAGFIPGADIKIEFTGLRPGEKLFEELMLEEEGLTKTESDKIYVAHPVNISAVLESDIAEDFGKAAGGEDIMALIRKYVPEYNNTKNN